MSRPMNAEASDVLRGYEEMIRRRERIPPMTPGPLGEAWRPAMTPQERKEHEQYVKDHSLPF